MPPLKTMIKEGKYTSEFWLTLLAQVLGSLVASGMLPQSHWASQIAGVLLMVLSAAGYTWSRTALKKEDLYYAFHQANGEDDDDDDDDDGEDSPDPVVPDNFPLNLGSN